MLLFKLSYIHSPNIQTVKISQHACLMSTISKFKKKKGSAMSSAYEQHTETETWLRTCTTSNDSHGDVLISGFFTPFAALLYTSLLLLLQEI